MEASFSKLHSFHPAAQTLGQNRYSTKCCDTGGGLYWWRPVLEEYKNYGLSIQGMLDAKIKSAGTNPWAESNFLKKAFLEGCQRAGLFDAIADGGAAP